MIRMILSTDMSRSREGAWIEINRKDMRSPAFTVAPVRERGLKYALTVNSHDNDMVAPVRERGLK